MSGLPSNRLLAIGWTTAAAVCIATISACAGFGLWTYRLALHRVSRSTQSSAGLVARALDSDAQRIKLALALTAGALDPQPQPAGSLDARTQQQLADVARGLGADADLFVVSQSGAVLFPTAVRSANPAFDAAWALKEQCRAHGCSPSGVSDPMPTRWARHRYVVFYRRCCTRPGNSGWLILVTVPVRALSEILQKANVGSEGISLLRDSQSRVIARVPPSTNPNEQPGASHFSPQLHRAIASGVRQKTFFSTKTGDGIVRIDTYRRLRVLPFHLVIGMAQENYLTAWRKTMMGVGSWAAGFCALILGAATLMTRLLRRQTEQAAHTEAILHSITDGMFVLDNHGCIVQVSESMCKTLGFRNHELLGREFSSVQAPGSVAVPTADDISPTVRQEFELACLDKSGQIRTMDASVLHYVSGGLHVRLVAVKDVTVRKVAEEELRTCALAFEARQGVLICNNEGRILQVNQTFLDFSGLDRVEIMGQSAFVLDSLSIDAEVLGAMRDSLMHEGHWEGLVTLPTANRGCAHLWLERSVVRSDTGAVTHYVSTYTQAAPPKEASRRLLEMAYYDALTKLPNRALLQARVDHALGKAHRTGELSVLLLFDLDFFKAVNDTQGHDAGDQLLIEVARRARQCVRSSDTIARLGGDEFAVLAEGFEGSRVAASSSAMQIAEELREAIGKALPLGDQMLYPTCSLGVVIFGDKPSSFQNLLKQADMALYAAKADGRNTALLFRPEMQVAASRRAELLSRMRTALEAHEFVLHYQPQFDRAGRMYGVEALMRWNSSLYGMVPPSEFIGIAEESGLIVSLGRRALELAFADIAAWSDDDLLSGLTVGVNVSPRQLRDPSFSKDLEALLQAHRLAAARVKLEVTESAVIDETAVVARNMEHLRRLGVSLSVDDFGTGYSNLANLQRLPFDQIKIDKSFVDGIVDSQSDRLMVETIVGLARNLGVQVVAEGVETHEQLGQLVRSGCDAFQGYLFAKPSSSEQFRRNARRLVSAADEMLGSCEMAPSEAALDAA